MAHDDAKSDDERLAEILASMGKSVREWVNQLESMARRLGAASSPDEAARALRALRELAHDTLRELAHDIGGSAGTLGFAEIGDAALPIELKCAEIVEAGETPTDGQCDEIMALVGGVVVAAKNSLEATND